jgi:hypothetical protein
VDGIDEGGPGLGDGVTVAVGGGVAAVTGGVLGAERSPEVEGAFDARSADGDVHAARPIASESATHVRIRGIRAR